MKFGKVIIKPHNCKGNTIVYSKDKVKDIKFVDPVSADCILFIQTDLLLDCSLDEVQFDGIQVDGHYGTWYTIDHEVRDGKLYYLCEHEEYGDETACVIIDLDGNLIMDEVWNGFDDLDCV